MSQPSADDPRVIAALEEYASAMKMGRAPDRQEFQARHPEIAAILAVCLDGLEFMRGAAPAAVASDLQFAGLTALGIPLGDFRIVREIGRGGMGIVYEAEQLSLGRRVALKVLPLAAALDPKHLQRFKNEVHAAAHLHHTNIVPVYAVGCERGVHFYAMQFIEGWSLATLLCELRQSAGLEVPDSSRRSAGAGALAEDMDSNRLAQARLGLQATGPYLPSSESPATVAAELIAAASVSPGVPALPKGTTFMRTVAKLGVQTAEALEHAHQLGVVHRDIKLGNLRLDVRGNIWITDFGLAHIQGHAKLTMTGDVVGTLHYMSPEQVLAAPGGIDHRTDIYSLGATLYELLTLQPAFPSNDRAELLRQIAFEEPRPPRRLKKTIPTELQTIVGKAMEKNPADRYATAQELADDLERFLKDKPIHARRPTLAQRLRKWSRRHRDVVAATLVSTILALTLGTILIGWQWSVAEERRIQAEKAEASANKSAAQLKAVNDFFFADLLGQASPYANPVGANNTIRQLLDNAAQRIEKNKTVAQQPEVEATIRHALGNTYNDLALFEEARVHLARALEIRRRVLGEKNPDTLEVRSVLASNAYFRGMSAEAERFYRENMADFNEIAGPEDEGTLYSMTMLGFTLQTQGKLDEAETLYRGVYEVGRRAREQNIETLRVGHFLAGALYERGRLDDAGAMLEENFEASRRFHGSDDHPEPLIDRMWEPMMLQARGKWDEAERRYRQVLKACHRVLGTEHHDTIGNTYNLAVLLHARGNWAEAESFFREVVPLSRKVLPNHPYTALALYAWGNLLLDKGEFKQAEPALRDALRIQRKALVEDHYSTGQTMAALGWALTKTDRAKEGEPLLREGLEICRQKLPKRDWFTADTESLLSGCLAAEGQYEKAEPLLLSGYNRLRAAAGNPPVTDSWPIRCMQSLHDSPGAPPGRIRQALDRLTSFYEAWGKPNQAAAWRAKR